MEKLRTGFTTGTCAAAAAKAAVRALSGGILQPCEEVVTPSGVKAVLRIEKTEQGNASVCCAVRKDAGDDPDVTNGVLVFASVRVAETLPAVPCYRSFTYENLFLCGGEGIGTVTKNGLSCPKGFHAINPVPREMIFKEAEQFSDFILNCEEKHKLLLIEISIPAGKELAEKTFNPKLGIEGGISILGTIGIVNPMSEQALLETIRLEIRVRKQEGKPILAVAPGNYGEAFLKTAMGISMDHFIKCSNFVGETFLMLKENGIREVLFAGHLGKLVKVAGGVLNTHSKYGDRRMEVLSDCAREAGADGRVIGKLSGMNTTEEAAGYLKEQKLLEPVMKIVMKRIQNVLEEHSTIRPEIVIFTAEAGISGMTERAETLAKRIESESEKEIKIKQKITDRIKDE